MFIYIYVQDKAGTKLNVTVVLGEAQLLEATHEVGGVRRFSVTATLDVIDSIQILDVGKHSSWKKNEQCNYYGDELRHDVTPER